MSRSDNRFDFKKQLDWSNIKEKEFASSVYKRYKLLPSDDRRWDFNTPRGLKIELKTDSYDADKTSNMFIERYSDIVKKTPGGPWRSLQDEIDVWIYWFYNNKLYFEFSDLPALVKELDKITEKMYVVTIPNKGWTTAGYKVPRDLLINHFKPVRYK